MKSRDPTSILIVMECVFVFLSYPEKGPVDNATHAGYIFP